VRASFSVHVPVIAVFVGHLWLFSVGSLSDTVAFQKEEVSQGLNRNKEKNYEH
jgi:hypothetical protein